MEEHGRVVTSDDLHTAYFDRSRKELQRKIEQLTHALTQVCHSAKTHIWILFAYIFSRKMRSLLLLQKKSSLKWP